jgi:hypothetical protein
MLGCSGRFHEQGFYVRWNLDGERRRRHFSTSLGAKGYTSLSGAFLFCVAITQCLRQNNL